MFFQKKKVHFRNSKTFGKLCVCFLGDSYFCNSEFKPVVSLTNGFSCGTESSLALSYKERGCFRISYLYSNSAVGLLCKLRKNVEHAAFLSRKTKLTLKRSLLKGRFNFTLIGSCGVFATALILEIFLHQFKWWFSWLSFEEISWILAWSGKILGFFPRFNLWREVIKLKESYLFV